MAERPQMDAICPATGKKLKLKDLTSVNFTRVPEGEDGFAMDPITKDTFTNANRLAVLKPTGKHFQLSVICNPCDLRLPVQPHSRTLGERLPEHCLILSELQPTFRLPHSKGE